MTRKPDPDRHTMELARVLEPHLDDIVSNRIRTLQALIEHAVPNDMVISILYMPSAVGSSWLLQITRDDQTLNRWQDSLEDAIKVVPELVGDIKKGRRKLT